MTKEECIADLKSINATGMECIDYAIKALEQQTSDDCVSRKFMYELGATCIATRNKNGKLIALGTIENLPPVTPTFPKGATNGDVIKAMFPDLEIANDGLINDNLTGIIAFYGGYNTSLPRGDNCFNRKWWNAPYKQIKR